MNTIGWGGLWTLIVASCIAYATYSVIGTYIEAEAEIRTSEVNVVHSIKDGSHSLAGILMVPSRCHGLALEVESRGARVFHLAFSAYEQFEGCKLDPEPRSFKAVTRVSSDNDLFTASMNGRPLPLHIVEK